MFDTCNCDEDGRISLLDLANRSRSVTEDNHVEQLLELFNLGEESSSGNDRVTFNQFVQRMVALMNSNNNHTDKQCSENHDNDTEDEEDEFEDAKPIPEIRNLNRRNSSTSFSPTITDQGAFNENLKRSFEKTRSSVTSSPNNAASKIVKRKPSSSRLTGNIPLVNTSSEDEAEDSFDRKIASSLEFARPLVQSLEKQAQPQQFLSRGSSLRTTVMRKNKSNPCSPNTRSSPSTRSSTLPHNLSASALPRQQMYPDTESSSRSSSTSSSECSAAPSPVPTSLSNNSNNRSQTKLVLKDLERKVAALSDNVVHNSSFSNNKNDFDSLSSGESLKADLEEEISSSILLARKHADERLEEERKYHSEELNSLERERDLERRNFQLRFEQIQEERDQLKSEVKSLKDKVELLNVEKTLLEQQMVENVNTQAVKEEECEEEEIKRRDREEELVNTVKTLSERVGDQDNQLAELKEDNNLLKKQIKELSVKENKPSGFRIFGTSKENVCSDNNIQDPQVKKFHEKSPNNSDCFVAGSKIKIETR